MENLVVFQLIEAMNDSVKKLEEAFARKDIEEFKRAKEEILNLQGKISEMLK